jgi:DNA-binding IclR family transcriptional regulator
MENSYSHMGIRAKTAARALDLLDTLAQAPESLRFTDLVRILGVPRSSLHELLTVLVDRAYVEHKRDSRTYALGIRVWENGQAYLRHHDLVRVARPEMERIVQDINETVQLAVLDGIENVYLDKVDCSHPIRLQSQVGQRLFAYATGLGKVLLAALPEAECMARLGMRALPGFTPQTITDRSLLLQELAMVREQGYALDNQEYTPGLCCVAVPIRDHHGSVVAAISVAIPIIRAKRAQLAEALSALATASLEIARRMGRAQDDPLLLVLCDTRRADAALAQHPALGSVEGVGGPLVTPTVMIQGRPSQ